MSKCQVLQSALQYHIGYNLPIYTSTNNRTLCFGPQHLQSRHFLVGLACDNPVTQSKCQSSISRATPTDMSNFSRLRWIQSLYSDHVNIIWEHLIFKTIMPYRSSKIGAFPTLYPINKSNPLLSSR